MARHLLAITGLEVVQLDSLHWRPGWVAIPKAAWRKTVAAVAAKVSWIIDGNYGGTMAIRLDRSDTMVFMDFTRITCVRRIKVMASVPGQDEARPGSVLSGAARLGVRQVGVGLPGPQAAVSDGEDRAPLRRVRGLRAAEPEQVRRIP